MQENIENLQLASTQSRAMAFVIDDFIVTLFLMLIFWDQIVVASADIQSMMELIGVKLITPLVCLKIVYHTFFVWYSGATIGKSITKIRVVNNETFGKVSLLSAFLRAGGRVLSEMFFYIGFAIAFFNDGRKTFHDFAGRTLVINV